MITYVNTVLVGTGVGTMASSVANAAKGQYVIVDENGAIVNASSAANAEAIKVGLATGTIEYFDANGAEQTTAEIKWSNIIKKADIKSYHFTEAEDETEDTVTFDFEKAETAAADEDIRVVIRLTFKDMPTRYRKWSESYEVFAPKGTRAANIVTEFVKIINVKDRKRARVTASDVDGLLQVKAMKYTDDNAKDSISPANKIRFSANAWYTRPEADGFESKNKYAAAVINKVPGVYPATAAKLVRDAEAQAMGYEGILNRGCCTWPIIKPDMNVELKDDNGNPIKYDGITLEFENMYRTADDLQRRTKQTLQIFELADGNKITPVKNVLEAFVKGEYTNANLGTIDADAPIAQ